MIKLMQYLTNSGNRNSLHKTMITIQKLPSLGPEMRGALRKHIMRKRQRLKQEMEQDAIEKRLKREREQERIQDAMTLDQIKEQLSNLEKRLETLRSEKHDLFVQLKQVLNEGNSKRKQSDAIVSNPTMLSQQKKTKLKGNENSPKATSNALAATSKTITNATIAQNDNEPIIGKPLSAIMSNERANKSDQFMLPERSQELTRIQSPRQILTLSPRSHVDFDSRMANNHLVPMSQPMSMIGPPPSMNHSHTNMASYKYPESAGGFSRHEILPPIPSSSSSMSPHNLDAFQAQIRYSLGGDGGAEGPHSIPSEFLIMSQRLNPNLQKLPPLGPHKMPLNTVPMSLPSSLSQGQHELLTNNKHHALGLNPLSTSQPPDDILPLKAHTAGPFGGHPNQFFIDNVLPPHLAQLNLLNHGLPIPGLDPTTSDAACQPGLGPNMVPSQYNHRAPVPHQLSRAGLDYIRPGGQQLRPNLLLPGLNALYLPHSSAALSSNSALYPGADFNHPLFQASLGQRMSGPMLSFNLTAQPQGHQQGQQQQQQSQLAPASRMFANNPGKYHRTSPKSQFYPNR